MKKSILLLILVASVSAVPAAIAGGYEKHREHREHREHQDHARYYDHAKVIRVEPIYRMVRISIPEEHCRQEPVHRPRDNYRTHNDTAGGVILGGIIGGVVGNQLGRGGNGRDIATVAGTVIGASIGHEIASNGNVVTSSVSYETHCRTKRRHHKERRIDGYNVTYRYKGETFTTVTRRDPGRRLRVMVNVVPVED